MTIAVSIENKDATRTLDIIETNRSRLSSEISESKSTLSPGERRTYHVYLLRDLTIRERDDIGGK